MHINMGYAVMVIVMASLVVHSNARHMPAATFNTDHHLSPLGEEKTFLPCIPRVPIPKPAAVVDAKNQQRFQVNIGAPAESPAGILKDSKNFIYGGGIGGYAGMGGYAGVVGGFPVLGGIHYGGIGGIGGVAGGIPGGASGLGGGAGGAGGGLGGGVGGGGLLPCP